MLGYRIGSLDRFDSALPAGQDRDGLEEESGGR